MKHIHPCPHCISTPACSDACTSVPDASLREGWELGEERICVHCDTRPSVHPDVHARVVAERDALHAALANLVAVQPRCRVCREAPATKAFRYVSGEGARYCDAHAPTDQPDDGAQYTPPTPPEREGAPALRAAMALLQGTP